MNVYCSVCGLDDDLKLLESPLLPRVRYITCATCRADKLHPRPLIVLAIKYGDADLARRLIKARGYHGEEIKASEIINLS